MRSPKNQSDHEVDQSAIKAAQVTTFLLLLIGFVLNNAWIVAATSLSQLVGATGVSWAPFRLIYRFIYRPLGKLKPNPQPDHHAPHRFASLVGGLFDAAGAALLFLGLPTDGWTLVWIVIVLANLNIWLGFCLGCWMYYTFSRFGVPGFRHGRLA